MSFLLCCIVEITGSENPLFLRICRSISRPLDVDCRCADGEWALDVEGAWSVVPKDRPSTDFLGGRTKFFLARMGLLELFGLGPQDFWNQLYGGKCICQTPITLNGEGVYYVWVI